MPLLVSHNSGRLLCLKAFFKTGALTAAAFCVSFLSSSLVRAQTPQLVTVSAASYRAEAIAPDSIVAGFGSNLATTTAVASSLPLPTELAGVSVEVNNRRAGLFFVSPNQLNYLIPAATETGTATVVVKAGTLTVATGSMQVRQTGPAIFTANSDGKGVPAAYALRISGGAQSNEPLVQYDPEAKSFLTRPLSLGPMGETVFLVLFGSGLRKAADPNGDGNVRESVRVLLGTVEVIPDYAGRQGELAGLDQINVGIPRSLLGQGYLEVSLRVAGATDSNQTGIELSVPAGSGPVASYQLVRTEEDTAKNFVLSGSDPQNRPLSYRVISGPVRGRVSGTGANLTYTPEKDYNRSRGSDSLRFVVSNGQQTSMVQQVLFDVSPVNDAPVLTITGNEAADAGQPISYTLTARDPDNDQLLTFTSPALPEGGDLVSVSTDSAKFTWVPTYTQAGSRSITFTVSDDGVPKLSDSKSTTLTIRAPWGRTSGPEGGTISALLATGNKVFAGTPGGGAYLSLTAGQSWGPATTGITDPYPTCFVTSGNNIFAGTHYGGVFRTGNEGRLWEPAREGLMLPSQAIRINALAVSGNMLLASRDGFEDDTRHGIFISADQGQSWRVANTGIPASTLTYSFVVRGSEIFAGTSKGIFVTKNQGQFWQAINGGLATNTECYSFALTSDGSLFAGTSAGAFFLFELAGNQSWVAVNTGLPSPVPAILSLTVRGSTLFASSGARLYASSSRTVRWNPADTGLPPDSFINVLENDGRSIFAGTLNAGAFRSTDDGRSWNQINTGIVAAGITSLATIDSHIFVSTGAPYLGASGADDVFRSSDQGQSWTRISIPVTPVPKVRALGVSGTSLFAASASSGVFRSDDLGKTWVPARSGLPTYLSGGQTLYTFVSSLAAVGTNLFVSTAPNAGFPRTSGVGGVWRSANKGQTWQVASNGLPSGVSVLSLAVSGTTLIAGTLSHGVFRSGDNGQTWTPASNGIVSPFSAVSAIGVSDMAWFAATGQNSTGPYSPFAFGGGAIYRSTDQGQTWTPVNNGIGITFFIYRFLINGPNVLAATNFGLYRNTMQGSLWTRVATGFSDNFTTSLAFGNGDLLAGTASASVIRLTNNVQSWNSPDSGLTTEAINALVSHGALVYAGTRGSGIFISTDRGRNWKKSGSGIIATTNVQALTIGADNTTIYAATFGDGIFSSTSQGQTWTLLNADPGLRFVSSLAGSGSSLLAVNANGELWRSDNGQTWTRANLGTAGAVALSLHTSGATTFCGADQGRLFISTDAGRTWALSTSLPQGSSTLPGSLDIRTILADSTGIYVGTLGAGVYCSVNGGQSWVPVNQGVPSDLVVYSMLRTGNKLYTGTSSGIFLSADNGTSWKQLNAGLLDISVFSLISEGDSMLAGTNGGLFLSRIP